MEYLSEFGSNILFWCLNATGMLYEDNSVNEHSQTEKNDWNWVVILNHEYRFIFFKTSKTASTSTEIALSRFCRAGDIITPIAPKDEQIRAEAGGLAPQNYRSRMSEWGPGDWKRFVLNGQRKLGFYNHIPAWAVRNLVGEDTWDSYFKFCIVRNPWDRLLSFYYYRNRSEPRIDLTDFLLSGKCNDLNTRGWNLYTIDDEIVVDDVCRFENLDDDLERIGRRLGLPGELDLPRANTQFREDRRPYDQILDDFQAEIVARLFRREIEAHGYSFR